MMPPGDMDTSQLTMVTPGDMVIGQLIMPPGDIDTGQLTMIPLGDNNTAQLVVHAHQKYRHDAPSDLHTGQLAMIPLGDMVISQLTIIPIVTWSKASLPSYHSDVS